MTEFWMSCINDVINKAIDKKCNWYVFLNLNALCMCLCSRLCYQLLTRKLVMHRLDTLLSMLSCSSRIAAGVHWTPSSDFAMFDSFKENVTGSGIMLWRNSLPADGLKRGKWILVKFPPNHIHCMQHNLRKMSAYKRVKCVWKRPCSAETQISFGVVV